MFKLVGVTEQDGQKAFAILNSEGTIEAITETDMKISLNYKLNVEGASLDDSGEIVYNPSLDFKEDDDEEDYETEYDEDDDEEDYDETTDEIELQLSRYAKRLTSIMEKSPDEIVAQLKNIWETGSTETLVQGTSEEYGVVQFQATYEDEDYIWGIDNEWYDDLDDAIDDYIGFINDSDGTDSYGNEDDEEEYDEDDDIEEDDEEDYEDASELSEEEAEELKREQWEEATDGNVYFDGENFVYKTNKIILPNFNNGDFSDPTKKFWGNVADFNFDEDDETDSDIDKATLSTQEKLFSYLDENKMQLLQKYFLYMSQFIFELDRGNVALKPSKKADFDAVRAAGRDLGHSWYYAGFVDMGYRGTSVCPNCGVRLRYNAISSCCHMPVYRLDVEKDGKTTLVNDDGNALGVWKRTHNGQCIKCGAKCDCVRTKVGTREIDRNSNDLICANCGTVVQQSNHYCTLNHQTRFIHLAWDITNSDMETFNGQVINADINNIIESTNCIKFGLDCVADFFEIAKDSTAFQVLKKVQNTCCTDMAEMAELYESHNGDISEINDSFTILDDLVPKLILKGVKYTFMKKDTYIPTQLFKLYVEMRKVGLLIPRSMIKFIRNYLVDWNLTEDKFSDGSKKFQHLGNSIGNISGAKKNTNDSYDSIGRVAEVLNDGWSNIQSVVDSWKAGYLRWGTPSNFTSRYLTAFFLYKLCGFYEYDAEKYTDEGGRGKGHQKELAEFYSSLDSSVRKDFNVIEYSYDFVSKLNDIVNYLDIDSNLATIRKALMSPHISKNYDGVYEKDSEREDFNKDVIMAYNADILLKIAELEKLTDYAYYRKIIRNELTVTIDDYKNSIQPIFWLEEQSKNFKSFADSYVDELVFKKNEAEAIAKQEREQERQRELAKMQMEEELKKQAQTVQQATTVSNSPAKTKKEVIDWLSNADLSSHKSSELAIKILDTVKGKDTCTDNQFYHLKKLYEEESGMKFEGTQQGGKMASADSISDEDIKVIDYMLAHRDLLDGKTLAIIDSVKKYGKATERQRKYVDIAIEKYKEVEG